jgi:hypothetical protein
MKRFKFLIYICALAVCLSIGGIDASAAGEVKLANDILVESFSTGGKTISEGTEFNLDVTFTKTETNAKVQIDPGSFIVKGQGLVVNLQKNMTIPMKCSGTNNVITLTCSYVNGSGDTIQSVNKITIDMVKYSDSGSSSAPTNTKKYKPELIIENQDIPTVRTGSTLDLDLKVRNAGSHTAKDITVEFIPPTDEGFIYETNTISLIDKIQQLKKTETSDLHYSFKVKDATQPKTYECQLKYTYYNLYGDLTEKTQKIYIKVKKGFPAIDLNITDVSYNPAVIEAGKEVELSFLVNNNNGLSSVSSIDVTLEGLNKGFTLSNGINSRTIRNLQPDSEGSKVTFNLFASTELKKGSYPLKAVLKYNDTSNKEQKVEKEIYLLVNNGKSADVSIQNLVAPEGQIPVNQSFDESFDIVNNGTIKAEDLIVTAKGEDQIVPMSQNIQIVNELEKGATKKLIFKFQPIEEAKTKSYMINIEVKGKTEEDFATITQYVGVYVKGKKEEDTDENNTSKPIIIIDNFKMDPKISDAGKKFDLDLSFKNTHDSKKVQNIKISLGAEQNNDDDKAKSGSVFTPDGTSSTFFIKEIAPGQSIGKQLKIFTIPFAASKVHKLNIEIYYEYESEKGLLTETIQDSIPITVVQPSSFITSDIKIPQSMFVGEPTDIEFEISNTGRTSLDNFTVIVEGFGSDNSRTYLGNLTTGDTTYYSNSIFAEQEGEIKGSLVFSYSKPNGETEEVRKEIKTMAEQMNYGPSEGEMNPKDFEQMMPHKKKSNKKLIIIIVSVAVVAIIVIIVIVRKKIKKKKELSFDE